jgi:hypothetical protein
MHDDNIHAGEPACVKSRKNNNLRGRTICIKGTV